MAFENTYLRLNSTLNCDPNPNHQNTQQNKNYLSSRLKFDNVLPTLSLGLPQEREEEKSKVYNPMQASNSPISGVSSYSDSSVKREREVVREEEIEVERDDHDEGFGVRKKLRLTKQQSIILEDSFKEHSTLNHKQKQELAKQLNLRPRQVEVWFQNRRARTRLKQTEFEYDIMKKLCETLANENKRLYKEIQDLKAVMAKSTFYLQLPDATLTVCSSCART